MSGGLDRVTRTCAQCGFPILARANTPCPYCFSETERSNEQMQAVLYGVPVTQLLRLKLAVKSPDGDKLRSVAAAISPRLVEWIGPNDAEKAAPFTPILATVLDVLLTLNAISEELATPGQLKDVIDGVVSGQLNRLPLLPRGPCFCDSGRRYKRCHGRRR